MHMKNASLCQSTSSKNKNKNKNLRRFSNPVDGPQLKQNGIGQTRSIYFVKGVSKVKSNAIRGKKKRERENKYSNTEKKKSKI